MKKLTINQMSEFKGGVNGTGCFLAGLQAATVLNPLTWPYSIAAAHYAIGCWNS
ncbi:hypothetical protein J2T03_001047 [Chryseobacterium lathyri]|nr:hypothetical protein [Chryseobacterium lathyri]